MPTHSRNTGGAPGAGPEETPLSPVCTNGPEPEIFQILRREQGTDAVAVRAGQWTALSRSMESHGAIAPHDW
ncbi:hypothetical protein [Streptomyces sp. JH34]|uniref:hypothetical protein n=1 Tax=Streptomyces sp. JH34 TaxID=2793633 RepID=UPI0023F80F0D|nr:hypothetical protein [Streptomyces sp. JH34]MDF6018130.1 hypothetical protein [Streptomyces sp. JH34]